VAEAAVLFNLSTLALLVGGCLLLWQNLGGRRRQVVLPTITGDPEAADVAERFKSNESSESCADNGAGLLNSAAAQEQDAPADVGATNQNHYASSVSAAIAKSRKAAA
jgi:hypothetical protein